MLNKFLHWLCVLGIFLPLPIAASAASITFGYDGTIRSAGGVGVLVGSAHHKVIYCGGVTYGSVFCVT